MFPLSLRGRFDDGQTVSGPCATWSGERGCCFWRDFGLCVRGHSLPDHRWAVRQSAQFVAHFLDTPFFAGLFESVAGSTSQQRFQCSPLSGSNVSWKQQVRTLVAGCQLRFCERRAVAHPIPNYLQRMQLLGACLRSAGSATTVMDVGPGVPQVP